MKITIVKTENWTALYVDDDLFVSRLTEIEPEQFILLGQKFPSNNLTSRIRRIYITDTELLCLNGLEYSCSDKLSKLESIKP